MKRLGIVIMIAAMLTSGAGLCHADKKKNSVYLFGISRSFNDSIVYFTDIQRIDAYIDNKTNFLSNRNEYSNQLREYLETQGQGTPTCVTEFSKNRAKIEKKYLKLKHRFSSKPGYEIKYITTESFKYNAIEE